MVGFIAAITPICREGNSQIFTFLRKQMVPDIGSVSNPPVALLITPNQQTNKKPRRYACSLSSPCPLFQTVKRCVLGFFSPSLPPLCLEPQCRLGGEQHGRPHDHQKVKGQNGSRGTEAVFALFTGTENHVTPQTHLKRVVHVS